MLRELLGRRRVASILVAAVGGHLLMAHGGSPLFTCPLHNLTGIACPGCGLSRGILALVTGNWQTALHYHAFTPYFIALGFLMALTAILPETPRQTLLQQVLQAEQKSHINAFTLVGFSVYGLIRMVAQMLHQIML